MKYRKINDATVQCIISNADMEAYGLTISDIFERNEKGEGFLRNVIERAHEEVGYEINSSNIAMQITPLKDKGLIVTFSDEGAEGFQGMLKQLKDILAGQAVNDMKEAMQALEEEERSGENPEEEISQPEKASVDEPLRIFWFETMGDLLEYSAASFGEKSLYSKLYKAQDGYYLVVEKNRLSWQNFNKISAQVLEFGRIYPYPKSKLDYLEEHGECLIEKQALGKLKKIGK